MQATKGTKNTNTISISFLRELRALRDEAVRR